MQQWTPLWATGALMSRVRVRSRYLLVHWLDMAGTAWPIVQLFEYFEKEAASSMMIGYAFKHKDVLFQ